MIFTYAALAAAAAYTASALKLDGHELPKDFKYGCGVSAYQVEGAWKADGKSPSIWDRFAQKKGNTVKSQNGNVAMDFYHSYAKDIPLFFSSTGIKTFDTTLAWTRILPGGTGSKPNKAGVDYYRRMAEATHKAGGTFTATLYHWDLPEVLQDRYKGWVSPKVVDDFGNYARVTMTALGDVVDDWISINEPRTFCTEGYGPDSVSAPAYNGTLVDQYHCFHNALLAHARAAEVHAELKKQGKVKGTFGIKIDGAPAKPYDPKSKKDQAAALRTMDMQEAGWALGPLTTGDYSQSLRQAFGKSLPAFTKQQSESLKKSYDAIYYDVYTSVYAKHVDGCNKDSDEWPICVEETSDKNGKPIGKVTGSDWNFLVNDTLYQGLHYFHDRWNLTKPIIVGETGLAVKGGDKQKLPQKLHDKDRVEWYRTYFAQMDRIFKEGNKVNLGGFTFWSCIANYEWHSGYDLDFGVIYAEPGANKPRHVKNSAHYLKDVLVNGLASSNKKWG